MRKNQQRQSSDARDGDAREEARALQIWSTSYRLLTSVINGVVPEINALGLETKELFVLAEIEQHPHPAALAARLSMPKPSVTVYLKRLEAGGFISREIDPTDLRRHRLMVTATGRKILTRGLGLLAKAFGARLERLTAAERGQLEGLLGRMSDGD